jgi:hypothetical protein
MVSKSQRYWCCVTVHHAPLSPPGLAPQQDRKRGEEPLHASVDGLILAEERARYRGLGGGGRKGETISEPSRRCYAHPNTARKRAGHATATRFPQPFGVMTARPAILPSCRRR